MACQICGGSHGTIICNDPRVRDIAMNIEMRMGARIIGRDTFISNVSENDDKHRITGRINGLSKEVVIRLIHDAEERVNQETMYIDENNRDAHVRYYELYKRQLSNYQRYDDNFLKTQEQKKIYRLPHNLAKVYKGNLQKYYYYMIDNIARQQPDVIEYTNLKEKRKEVIKVKREKKKELFVMARNMIKTKTRKMGRWAYNNMDQSNPKDIMSQFIENVKTSLTKKYEEDPEINKKITEIDELSEKYEREIQNCIENRMNEMVITNNNEFRMTQYELNKIARRGMREARRNCLRQNGANIPMFRIEIREEAIETNDTQCSICWDEANSTNCIRTNCGHDYCGTCITTHMNTTRNIHSQKYRNAPRYNERFKLCCAMCRENITKFTHHGGIQDELIERARLTIIRST